MADQRQTTLSLLRQLKQDKIWVDKAGVPHDLNSIDPRHRANLIPFLRAWAPFLFPELDQRAAQEELEKSRLMQRLVELEAGKPVETRHAEHAANIAYEIETGYEKVRPRPHLSQCGVNVGLDCTCLERTTT